MLNYRTNSIDENTEAGLQGALLDHPLWDAQVDLEAEMVSVGQERFYRAIEQAKARGEESGTGYGARLMRQLVLPTTTAIDAFVAECKTGKAGRRHIALQYIDLVEPEVAAFLTLKVVLDGITKQDTAQRVAIRIASAIQDEVWVTRYKEAAPKEYKRTMKHIDEATSRRHKQKVARIMAKRAGVEEKWPASDMLHLGMKLIEILRATTGLIDFQTRKKGVNDSEVIIVATPETMAWITNANEGSDMLHPAYLPTVIPPKPWTGPRGGGYWTGVVRPLGLVKTHSRAFLEELASAEPTAVYDAVNAMQNTPWRINTRVREVIRAGWEQGTTMRGLPSADAEPLPLKPSDIDTNEAAKKSWKKAAAMIHVGNAKAKSKRLQLRKVLQIADTFGAYEAIYFPHQLDFRGRAYAVPMFLNPQGPDFAKALLLFAEGKPLGNKAAADWLAIHGANTYGFDKAPMPGRVAWTEERNDLIASVAADPFGDAYEFWTKADKPWQFLAFCFEWAGFLREGYAYSSSLPIAMDGSCNGLQHYSAALRDPVGGAAVNLVPGEKPKDIYAAVAEVALRYVEAFARPNAPAAVSVEQFDERREMWAEHGMDPQDLARKWLAFGLDRKITKRPVMTMPYGSSQRSCRDFIDEAMREKIGEGKANPFADAEGDGVFQAALFLQPIVWAAIGEVVQAARVGMDWLKECARLAAAEGLPVLWTTPDGFPVQQSYMDSKARRVKTHLDGGVTFLTLREELPTVNKQKQAQGVAPNWVHSMDATAMRMFVNLAASRGLTAFALIHDSYGTLAADTDTLGQCLREAFVSLYREQDPMAEFRVDIAMVLSDKALKKLPAVPARGTLDLSLVEQSVYFFA